MLILTCVMASGWLLAATLGTWAYFAGDANLNRSLTRKASSL